MIFANLFTFSALIYLVSSNLEAIAPIIRAAKIRAAQIKAGQIFRLIDVTRLQLTSADIYPPRQYKYQVHIFDPINEYW